MENKQLMDWIKKEKAKGHTDEQMKDYLLEHGYDKISVESAFPKKSEKPLAKSNHFQLGKYLDSITGIVLVLSVISIMFVSYAAGIVFWGLAFLAGIGIAAFVSDRFYKKGKVAVARWSSVILIILAEIIIVMIGMIGAGEARILFPLFMMIVMIHPIIYQIKSKGALPFESVFLTFLISLFLSEAITLIGCLILVFGILPVLGEVATLPLTLMTALIGTLRVASYILISVWLLKRLPNGFSYGAYFRSRHFPFTIFNLFSPKEENVKKAVIGISAAFCAAAVIFSLIAVSILGVYYSFETDSKFGNALSNILGGSYNPDRIIEFRGFNVTETRGYISPEGFVSSAERIKNDDSIKTLFYDCDVEIRCLQKDYLFGVGLGEQGVNLEGVGTFIVAENSSEKVIFLIPRLTAEENAKLSMFTGMDDELKQSPIALELDQEYIDIKQRSYELRESRLNRYERYREDKKELALLFLSIPFSESWMDEYLDTIQNQINYIAKFGIMLSKGHMIINEYEKITENKLDGKKFQDGTSTPAEHLAALKSNIGTLYPRWVEEDHNLEDEREDIENGVPRMFNDESYMTLYEIVINRLTLYSTFSKKTQVEMTDMSAELEEIRSDREWITEMYDNRDVSESETAKIIRFAMIQKRIANDIFGSCDDDLECKKEIVKLTGDPDLCFNLCTSERRVMPSSEYTNCKAECSMRK